jgi:hypothetical protein
VPSFVRTPPSSIKTIDDFSKAVEKGKEELKERGFLEMSSDGNASEISIGECK